MKAMEISQSGMDVEWRRLEVIADNLANMNTSRTAMGDVYQPMRLISGPKAGFAQYLQKTPIDASAMQGVTVYGVEPLNIPPKVVYQPEDPQADAKGFVAYPGIDHSEEMTLMVKAARAYEADIVAMNSAREMYLKAADIGKRS